MAILNNDAYVSPQGISVTGTYMTFGKRRITVQKDGASFKLSGRCCIFKDSTSYSNGSECLDEEDFTLIIPVSNLEHNLYTELYTHLKTIYTNFTNA
jgi:hypothetical protein